VAKVARRVGQADGLARRVPRGGLAWRAARVGRAGWLVWLAPRGGLAWRARRVGLAWLARCGGQPDETARLEVGRWPG